MNIVAVAKDAAQERLNAVPELEYQQIEGGRPADQAGLGGKRRNRAGEKPSSSTASSGPKKVALIFCR